MTKRKRSYSNSPPGKAPRHQDCHSRESGNPILSILVQHIYVLDSWFHFFFSLRLGAKNIVEIVLLNIIVEHYIGKSLFVSAQWRVELTRWLDGQAFEIQAHKGEPHIF